MALPQGMPRANWRTLMRCTSTTLFFVLFALSITQLVVSQVFVSESDKPTEYPTGQEWEEHRKKCKEVEKKMRECEDQVEFEKLCLQHIALINKWRLRINPPPLRSSKS
jgi:hypothetical protein